MPSTTVKPSGLPAIDAAGLAVFLAISSLWYVTTLRPLLEQRSVVAGLHQEIEDRERRSEDLKTAAAAATRQLTAVRQELSAGGVDLDSAAHINRRIARLTEFFAGCALHIDDVQTGAVSSGLQCDLVPMTFVGRGTYPQCVRFLHGLPAQFADMSVMRVELTGIPSRTVEPERFRFEMFWYAAPDSAARGPTRANANPAPAPAERNSRGNRSSAP